LNARLFYDDFALTAAVLCNAPHWQRHCVPRCDCIWTFAI